MILISGPYTGRIAEYYWLVRRGELETRLSGEVRSAPTFTLDSRDGVIVGPGGTVRLEPKVMEVLTVLSGHPGHVVSRNELMDKVWPGVIVTEHTLTRCIYQLRRDLHEAIGQQESADFNPIETLPKRGYRLLVSFEESPAADVSQPLVRAPASPIIPYVVGQWVRGKRFYGRAAQISEILDGHRNCIWLIGTRRIGKTSLLKQIELIAATEPEPRYFPVFWDFQGADTPEELHLNFEDALLDAEDRLRQIDIAVEKLRGEDLFDALDRLRRRLRAKKLRLLLLCDEVEELIGLQQTNPSLLSKLRHAVQSRDDVRTVLASTIRLWALAGQEVHTSPFLHGFTPPLYIERFSAAEAHALIEQTNLAPGERPDIELEIAVTIRERCDNHPFLVQLVCKRYVETGDLEEAIEQVATDRMVSYFFSVDFNMLSDSEREIIRLIASEPAATGRSVEDALAISPVAARGHLRQLEDLGYIRRKDDDRLELANYFFRTWLEVVDGR